MRTLRRSRSVLFCGLFIWGLFFVSACSLFESDEEKADKGFNAALAAIEGNNTDEAMIHLKNVVQLQPNHPRAHYRLGTLYFQNKEPRMVMQGLLTALNQKPDYREPRRMVASFFYGIRRIEEAIPHYQKLLEIDADNLQARLALGDCLVKTEQFDQGIAVFQEAVKASPRKVEGRIGLARAFVAAGDEEQAAETLKKAKANIPDHPAPRMLLVRWHENNGRYEKAEQELRELIDIQADEAGSYFLSARYWLRRKNLDRAEQALQEGLDRGVADPKLLHGMALVNHYRGKTDTALDWFQKAAAEFPEDRNSLMLLGDYYLYRQKTAQATASYEQVVAKWPEMKEVKAKVELDGTQGEYHLHLGKVLYEDQDLERAREQLDQALERGLNPEQREQADQLLQDIEDKT